MNAGTKVAGMYMGQIPFTGAVVNSRGLLVQTDGAVEHTVVFDSPIIVYGMERTRGLVITTEDGSPSSYTKYTDKMSAN
jgi:hypothetical protein